MELGLAEAKALIARTNDPINVQYNEIDVVSSTQKRRQRKKEREREAERNKCTDNIDC